jgi:thioredoxin reductase
MIPHPPRFGRDLRVAIIGAGISGVCTAAHLLRQGLSVTVFERSSIAGGVWHFDERVSDDPCYPNLGPSYGDYHVSRQGEHPSRPITPESSTSDGLARGAKGASLKNDANLAVRFSPPGPCYAGLKNNVPTSLMYSSLGPWPAGTDNYTAQGNLEIYIQRLAADHRVDQVTRYHTRVDEVLKHSGSNQWTIRTVKLDYGDKSHPVIEQVWQFDAVVVSSGHYNMPRTPEIEGLSNWKQLFGERILHSKQYRSPDKYRQKTVLVIGGGVSAVDICRELDGVARKTYQSVRGGAYDLPVMMLPPQTERIGEIGRFITTSLDEGKFQLKTGDPLPGIVVLKSGEELTNIDHIIVATGYIMSYPFLSQLHGDTTRDSEAGHRLLVTKEGEMTHNLHRDIFYIPDPTLSFVGVPYHTATFSLFDFQAQVVARVFAGLALLPSEAEMETEYKARVEEKGLGRDFHSLRGRGREILYVRELVEWMNRGLKVNDMFQRENGSNGNSRLETETEPMLGHSEIWVQGYWELRKRLDKLWNKEDSTSVQAASGSIQL